MRRTRSRLGRESKLVAREDGAGLVDASHEVGALLEPVVFGRDEPVPDDLVVGDVVERAEVAGAVIVVLQQERVVVARARERELRDRLVAAALIHCPSLLPRQKWIAHLAPGSDAMPFSRSMPSVSIRCGEIPRDS